jgi:hypothetical protein
MSFFPPVSFIIYKMKRFLCRRPIRQSFFNGYVDAVLDERSTIPALTQKVYVYAFGPIIFSGRT